MARIVVALTIIGVLLLLAVMPVATAGGIVTQNGMVEYQYDYTHQVGVWTIKSDAGIAIAVLPAKQFTSPEDPMLLR